MWGDACLLADRKEQEKLNSSWKRQDFPLKGMVSEEASLSGLGSYENLHCVSHRFLYSFGIVYTCVLPTVLGRTENCCCDPVGQGSDSCHCCGLKGLLELPKSIIQCLSAKRFEAGGSFKLRRCVITFELWTTWGCRQKGQKGSITSPVL